MDRAKHGDLDCLSELFERHHVGLFNFFFYQLKEKAKSEDLTQNVFEKLIKHRDKYDVNKPFKLKTKRATKKQGWKSQWDS